MKKDFRFFKRSDDLSQKNIIDIYNIMDIWRNLKQSQVNDFNIVIVCKKNSTNLDHLIEMFQKPRYLHFVFKVISMVVFCTFIPIAL